MLILVVASRPVVSPRIGQHRPALSLSLSLSRCIRTGKVHITGGDPRWCFDVSSGSMTTRSDTLHQNGGMNAWQRWVCCIMMRRCCWLASLGHDHDSECHKWWRMKHENRLMRLAVVAIRLALKTRPFSAVRFYTYSPVGAGHCLLYSKCCSPLASLLLLCFFCLRVLQKELVLIVPTTHSAHVRR